MAKNHAGWIVTEDLRGMSPQEGHIGAVSPSMTPEAYLRLADAAQERDIEALIHRIRAKDVNDPARFMTNPRLRGSKNPVARVLSPVWAGMRGLVGLIRWGGKRTANILRRQRRGFSAPTSMHATAPTKRSTATNRAQANVEQAHSAPAKTANPPAPAYWDRAHEWEISNAQGEVLYRGQGIGVEGDSVAAQRARRAPLDEIPGLPRDAKIQWRDQPDWAVTGVSAGAAARSVVHVTGAALADGGLSWASVRQAAHDARQVVRGSAEPEPSVLDAALERMQARHGGESPTDEAVQAALNRIAESQGEEAPTFRSDDTIDVDAPDVSPDVPEHQQVYDDIPVQDPPPDYDRVVGL